MRFSIFISFLFLAQLLFAKPERFRVIICENPATSITIAWDQVSGTNPELLFGSDDYGNKASLYQKRATPSNMTANTGRQMQLSLRMIRQGSTPS